MADIDTSSPTASSETSATSAIFQELIRRRTALPFVGFTLKLVNGESLRFVSPQFAFNEAIIGYFAPRHDPAANKNANADSTSKVRPLIRHIRLADIEAVKLDHSSLDNARA
jgi:hypothetical protein